MLLVGGIARHGGAVRPEIWREVFGRKLHCHRLTAENSLGVVIGVLAKAEDRAERRRGVEPVAAAEQQAGAADAKRSDQPAANRILKLARHRLPPLDSGGRASAHSGR